MMGQCFLFPVGVKPPSSLHRSDYTHSILTVPAVMFRPHLKFGIKLSVKREVKHVCKI